MGEIDFGQGIQYEIKGKERQRYCVPCHDRISRGEEIPVAEPADKNENTGETKCAVTAVETTAKTTPKS